MTDQKKPPDGRESGVPPTGDPKLDTLFARLMANAAKKEAAGAETEPQRGPESAPATPRGVGVGWERPRTARSRPQSRPRCGPIPSSRSWSKESPRLGSAKLDAWRSGGSSRTRSLSRPSFLYSRPPKARALQSSTLGLAGRPHHSKRPRRAPRFEAGRRCLPPHAPRSGPHVGGSRRPSANCGTSSSPMGGSAGETGHPSGMLF